jgi:hypothetical protein
MHPNANERFDLEESFLKRLIERERHLSAARVLLDRNLARVDATLQTLAVGNAKLDESVREAVGRRKRIKLQDRRSD